MCNNCRYKAKVDDEVDDYGRICVAEGGGLVFLRSDREDGYIATWHCDVRDIMGISGRKVTDFEIVPRDPETYKDWQEGDIIGCEDENGDIDIMADHLCRVIFRSGELVAIAENYSAEEADINGCYTCSQLFREGWRLVLTDIEQQIIEERKKYEPQDGDIVAWKEKEDEDRSAISIYRKKNRAYFTLFVDGITGGLLHNLAMNIVRPATDEEKQRLFDAMAKKGMRWNAEKKVVEDIPKPYEFRKGEPVLVRSDRTHCWQLRAISLSVYGNPPKVEVTDGCDEWIYWIDKDEVIPYNEKTMHLLGTAEDYKEGE